MTTRVFKADAQLPSYDDRSDAAANLKQLLEYLRRAVGDVQGGGGTLPVEGQPLQGGRPDVPPMVWSRQDSNSPADTALLGPVTEVPVGALLLWPGEFVPPNCIVCDGRVLVKADYPELYTVLGPSSSVNDVAFRVPDWRGKIPIGAPSSSGIAVERFFEEGS